MDTGEPCSYFRTVVGSNIGRLCDTCDISQKTLSQMVGMNRSYLNELISGKANPSLDKLVKIADALEVPITELFSGVDHDAPGNIRVSYDSLGERNDR